MCVLCLWGEKVVEVNLAKAAKISRLISKCLTFEHKQKIIRQSSEIGIRFSFSWFTTTLSNVSEVGYLCIPL